MARRAPALFVIVGLIPTPLGCSRADNAADRHAAEMREAITRLEADADKVDQRLGNLEVAMAEDRQNRAAEAGPKGSPAPPPRVVQLGASPDSGENDDPNAPEARPEIRLVGQPGAHRPPRGVKSRVEDVTPSEPPPRTSAFDPEAKRAYEQALALVQGKQYARGSDQLAAFLVKWPDHPYAENAMYWRGEAFFSQGEYLRAAEQFEAVLSRFGGGKKGPDALLKLGMCHDRLGVPARAQEYWDRLRNDHPHSDAAKRIPSAAPKTDRWPKGPKESR